MRDEPALAGWRTLSSTVPAPLQIGTLGPRVLSQTCLHRGRKCSVSPPWPTWEAHPVTSEFLDPLPSPWIPCPHSQMLRKLCPLGSGSIPNRKGHTLSLHLVPCSLRESQEGKGTTAISSSRLPMVPGPWALTGRPLIESVSSSLSNNHRLFSHSGHILYQL